MGETVFLNEQGSDNLSFLGALNEEDQNRYNEQNKKEESTMRLNNPGEPTKN